MWQACRILRLALLLGGGVALAGCGQGAETPPTADNAVISMQSETLTPDDLRVVSDSSADAAYRLGPDDVIAVTVYMHPDLTTPQAQTGGATDGALITSDGTVQLPLIGAVELGGLTMADAQAALTTAYAPYVRNPRINIQLRQAQSLRYYLLGAFSDPGVKYPVRGLTLLEALALGGSVDIPAADLHQAYVAQGRVKLPVDLYALLIDGDLSQNIPLAAGDTVVVPSAANENAFVFGAVGKPGPVPFESGALSLLQAIASAGMDLPAYTDARLSRIHIIRAGGRQAQFLVVDAQLILQGQAASFALQPGDIVFVPPTAVATWNQVISQLIPSLQTVSDVLNPFVAIKYLQR